jgi:uncharacterized protein YndB with AHSA1/START domain
VNFNCALGGATGGEPEREKVVAMKLLVLVFASLAGVVGVMALIGALLPRHHVATRCAGFRKTPEEVYAIVRDFAQTPTWRSHVQSVDLLPSQQNRVYYRETTTHGAIVYQVITDQPAKQLVTEIADRDLPFGGSWTFEFAPSASGGTTLRITERGEVRNVLFRFLSRCVLGYTRTLETYLRDLGRRLGEEATILS